MDHWTTGMDHWTTGTLEWTTGTCLLLVLSINANRTHACMHAQKGYFNNGLVAGVASLSFYTTQFL